MPEKTVDTAKYNANELLKSIKLLDAEISACQAKAAKEQERIRQEYYNRLTPLQEKLAGLDKDIRKLMKRNKIVLFIDTDKVALENGILIYGTEPKVIIPRGALARAEEHGLDEAIHVAKSLDRAVVKTWPDDKLELIGATRKPSEQFEYETR